MAENTDTGLYNAKNFLYPIEGGLVEKFDRLFDDREKKLKSWLAKAIQNKQEFLSRTFPNLISIGAEHPQLSGGVLYMMGLISPHIHGGTEAINSIPRRFAERNATYKDKAASKTLKEFHSGIPIETQKITPVVSSEMKRTEITKQLYIFTKRFVDVRYEKNGQIVDLGKNGCLVSTLNPDSTTGKTMVFLCSSGGDPPGVESFAVEYAMRTRDRVYVVGMPDSASGSITREFAENAFTDARPPAIDLFRSFKPPTYEAHTAFFRAMIESLVPQDTQFDLYAHSGGTLAAKNLLNMADFSTRVQNAVFLNPAGTTDQYTRLPFLFRIKPVITQWIQALLDLPKMVRSNYEKDKRQDARTPDYMFRHRVTTAIQDGTHYRQPGWDTMNVNGGKIVLYVGGRDGLVGGKQFAQYIKPRIGNTQINLEYDKSAHHVTPFTEPEAVFDRIFSKYFPNRVTTL